MSRKVIHTERAPQAIGTYSQVIRVGDTVYLSGQIPLDPATKELVSGDIEAETRRVFEDLKAARRPREAASAGRESQPLSDRPRDFAKVNEIMALYFPQPYPARAAVGVAQLPRGARVEAECVLTLADVPSGVKQRDTATRHRDVPGRRRWPGLGKNHAFSRRPRWSGQDARIQRIPPDQRPITALRGVGDALAERLGRLGIAQVQDLLFVLPLRYEDRTTVSGSAPCFPGRAR